MKNLDCIQIEIFINLEIIGEEDKNYYDICDLLVRRTYVTVLCN